MDVIEAIKSRYSVRAFKAVPVPRKVLEELLTVSQRSPSWANTQTWEFAVVGGDVMKDIRETLAARAFSQDDRNRTFLIQNGRDNIKSAAAATVTGYTTFWASREKI